MPGETLGPSGAVSASADSKSAIRQDTILRYERSPAFVLICLRLHRAGKRAGYGRLQRPLRKASCEAELRALDQCWLRQRLIRR